MSETKIACPDCSTPAALVLPTAKQIGRAPFVRRTCPHCLTAYRLNLSGVTAVVERDKHYSYRALSDNRLKANIIINGLLLCAACNQPFSPSEVIDGKIETDGKRRIKRQSGWILNGDTFSPNWETRLIPKILRGPICIGCMNAYNGKQVQSADDRLKAKSSRPDIRLYSNSAREDYGFPVFAPTLVGKTFVHTEVFDASGERQPYSIHDRDYLDPDPTWAHTGDPTWIAPSMILIGRKPAAWARTGYWFKNEKDRWCFREAIIHAKKRNPAMIDLPPVVTFNPIAEIDRAIYRGPLSSTKPLIALEPGSLGRPEHTNRIPYIRPYSPIRSYSRPQRAIVREISYRDDLDLGVFGKVSVTKVRKVIWCKLVSGVREVGYAVEPKGQCIHLLPKVMCAVCGPAVPSADAWKAWKDRAKA